MKKLIVVLTLLAMTFTSVLGYSVVQYILSREVEETVTVGNTTISEYGIELNLLNYDDYNLTYLDVPEDENNKHYLTYEYGYETKIAYTDIIVTSNDDIVIQDLIVGDTIIITFSLNQEKDFTEGDVVSIIFTFELIELSLGGYTPSNPLNINEATEEELLSIGLSEVAVHYTLQETSQQPITDVTDWALRIGSAGFVDRYSQYTEANILIFE